MADASEEEEIKSKKLKAGSFQAMGLDKDIVKGLNRMGYTVPTPVQRKALPVVIAGVDVVCMARTGSGKTCVFLLPMVQRLKAHDPVAGVRAVILSPTRELALQTTKFAKDMAKFTDLRIVSVVGGDAIEAQFEALSSHPDILIATPGRLMHHLREIENFKLKHVKYLVFDEADRLFEMGFAEQLNEIVRACPAERQTLLFSATLPKQLVQFSRAGLRDPQLIRLDTDVKLSEELRLAFFYVRSNEKIAALLYLVRKIIPPNQLTIIFTATKHHSEFLHALLETIGVSSTLIYGAMDQEVRTANLKLFRNGHVNYLIVTDVAARGIDVPLLNNVINFHFPSAPKLFVHRCGRAARQGRVGFALSLVEPEELAYMVDVHHFLGAEVHTSMTSRKDSDVGNAEHEHTEAGPAEVPMVPYSLLSMTPSNVDTGLLPQDVLEEENDFVKRLLQENDTLSTLHRISENGMQQYRRTRSEASHDGVKGAKALVKGDLIRSIHPLIAGEDPTKCSESVVQKANFVRMLQTFRPSQTVFETGIGTGATSNAAKAKAKVGSKESKGVEIMKALRKTTVTALERNKKSLTVENIFENTSSGGLVPDASNRLNKSSKEDWRDSYENDGDDIRETLQDEYSSDAEEEAADCVDEATSVSLNAAKPRLSIAEKKKLKKKGLDNAAIARIAADRASQNALIEESVVSGSLDKKRSFQDKKYFMSYGTEDEVRNFSEEHLQPQSGLRNGEAFNAARLESAMLDICPEDAMEMNSKRKMTRWDAKKKKFVKQTLDEMKEAKMMRSESCLKRKAGGGGGTKSLGEIYEAWKKKTRREIHLAGTGDDDAGSSDGARPRPNVKVNTHVKDELRSAEEIRKLHAKRDNNRMKNLNKDKRRSMEGRQRKQKAAAAAGNDSRRMRVGNKAGGKQLRVIVRN